MRSVLCLLCVCASWGRGGGQSAGAAARTVSLRQGTVRGYKSTDGLLYTFYGIPYATMPTGQQRYMPPLEAPSWSGTLEATDSSIQCPQMKMAVVANITQTSTNYSNDDGPNCLIVNVLVPDYSDGNKPVLVSVYGGAYQAGSGFTAEGNWKMNAFISQGNFVTVTFNYRVGVHGFLCLGTDLVPGNAGLKDMVALLNWVKTNIAAFGGDPNNVTLTGFSSGAASADLLYLAAEGAAGNLFHKVLLESGSAVSSWGVDPDPVFSAMRHAGFLNKSTDDILQLEKLYTETSLENLLAVAQADYPDNSQSFLPCVERVNGTEPFLTQSPIEIYKKGDIAKIPYMVGFSEMEGLARINNFDDFRELMNTDFSKCLALDLELNDPIKKATIAKIVKEFYFGDKNVTAETVRYYINYIGDVIFAYPAVRAARLMAEAGHDAVYLYYFTYADSESTRPNEFNITGAGHCAQTEMLFDLSASDEAAATENYKQVRALLMDMWTSFIRHGRPVVQSTATLSWPSTTALGSPYFHIDYPSKLEQHTLLARRVQFWDSVYAQYYRSPQPPPITFRTNDAATTPFSRYLIFLISIKVISILF